jgi:hypothetical protein
MNLHALLADPGPATWQDLAREWFDVTLPPPALESGLDWAPPALRQVWECGGRVPALFGSLTLLTPEPHSPTTDRVAFLAFEDEYQSVRWEAELDGSDDPPVLRAESGRLNKNRTGGIEPERLQRFLLQTLLYEAVLCAPHLRSAMSVTAAEADQILEGFATVAVSPWEWPVHTSFLYAKELLALKYRDEGKPPRFFIDVGARSPEPLAPVVARSPEALEAW